MPDGSVCNDIRKWREKQTTCKWWQRHQWGKWEWKISYFKNTNYMEMNVPYKYRMERTCKRCGEIQSKYIWL